MSIRLSNHFSSSFSSSHASRPFAVSDCSIPLPPGKKYICVETLNKKHVFFVIQIKVTRVAHIFDQVCSHINIQERHIFGLCLQVPLPSSFCPDDDNRFSEINCKEFQFLENTQKISKYVPKVLKEKHGNGLNPISKLPIFKIFFRVKCYIETFSNLRDPVCKEHYYLQIKENYLTYNQVNEDSCYILSAYALQTELGNYSEVIANYSPYFRPNLFFSFVGMHINRFSYLGLLSLISQVVERRGEQYILANTPRLHMELRDLSCSEAQSEFIQRASPLHAMHLYSVSSQKHTPSLSSTPFSDILSASYLWIGISPFFLQFFQYTNAYPSKVPLSKFAWKDISRLHSEKKKFEVSCVRVFRYYTGGEERSLNILYLCKETHKANLAFKQTFKSASNFDILNFDLNSHLKSVNINEIHGSECRCCYDDSSKLAHDHHSKNSKLVSSLPHSIKFNMNKNSKVHKSPSYIAVNKMDKLKSMVNLTDGKTHSTENNASFKQNKGDNEIRTRKSSDPSTENRSEWESRNQNIFSTYQDMSQVRIANETSPRASNVSLPTNLEARRKKPISIDLSPSYSHGGVAKNNNMQEPSRENHEEIELNKLTGLKKFFNKKSLAVKARALRSSESFSKWHFPLIKTSDKKFHYHVSYSSSIKKTNHESLSISDLDKNNNKANPRLMTNVDFLDSLEDSDIISCPNKGKGFHKSSISDPYLSNSSANANRFNDRKSASLLDMPMLKTKDQKFQNEESNSIKSPQIKESVTKEIKEKETQSRKEISLPMMQPNEKLITKEKHLSSHSFHNQLYNNRNNERVREETGYLKKKVYANDLKLSASYSSNDWHSTKKDKVPNILRLKNGFTNANIQVPICPDERKHHDVLTTSSIPHQLRKAPPSYFSIYNNNVLQKN